MHNRASRHSLGQHSGPGRVDAEARTVLDFKSQADPGGAGNPGLGVARVGASQHRPTCRRPCPPPRTSPLRGARAVALAAPPAGPRVAWSRGATTTPAEVCPTQGLSAHHLTNTSVTHC